MLKLLITTIILTASLGARANCDINLEIKNTGERSFEVHNQWESQVKGGLWRALNSNQWLPDETYFDLKPTEVKGDILNGLFNCGAKRRYKITYTCNYGRFQNRTFVEYFPSADTWTTNQTVRIKIDKCIL